MDKDFAPDLITLVDEQNVEHNFEILDELETDKGLFYALLPVFDDANDSLNDDGECLIMEVVEEDGEENLYEVEDEELFDELAELFQQRIDGLLYED